MNTFLIALLSIVFSVAAQFCLKAGMGSASVRVAVAKPPGIDTVWTIFTNKFVFGGFVLYGLGAVVWLTVLSKWDVSKAYPLVGMGFILTTGIGLLLGEEVRLVRLAGVLMIGIGVAIVART